MPVARRNSLLTVATVITVGLGLSYFAYDLADHAESEATRSALEVRAEWRAKDFKHKLETFATLPLNALAAFVKTAPAFSADDFRSIAEHAREEPNPVLAVAWAPRILAADRAAHEVRRRVEVGAEYHILERTPDERIVLAGPREEYFPVHTMAAFEGTPRLLGFDVTHDPLRRVAAESARDEGRPFATASITLAGSPTSGRSYLVFHPVYEGLTPTDVEQRRLMLRGYVVGVYRFHQVLQAAIDGTPDILSNLHFYVGGASADRLKVATYNARERRIVDPADLPAEPGGLTIERGFSALNQDWHLVFQFPHDAVDSLRAPSDKAVLVLGILTTLLLAAFLYRERERMLVVQKAASRNAADLSRANREQETIIDASLVAIIVLDADYKVRIWNAAAARIFGFEPYEVIGKPYPLVPAEGRAEFEAMFSRVRSGQIIHDMEVRRLTKRGPLVDVVFSGVPLYDAEGKFRGALFTLEDITEKKAIQQQLAQAQKMEAVGQLTGGIAHDFNNVLGAVIGNLDLAVLKLGNDAETLEIVSDALNAALRGSELVQRLLAFSRKQPLQPQLVDVRTSLEAVAPLLRRSLGERIAIETSTAEDVWPVKVDPVQLQNAILNLAINARDAMPEGGSLTIEAKNFQLDEAFAKIYPDLEPGTYVAIAVTDTGVGMSAEVQARAFEPFFSTKGAGKGTGLGLSMVYGTLKQSGGTAKIYSEVGKGTTIRLFLPRAEDESETAHSVPSLSHDLPRGSEHILVVEDNLDMRKVATGILRSLGYRITEAANADAALKLLLDGQSFDLVFSDVVMPGVLDGVGLAREIKRLRPNLAVLLTSGFSSRFARASEIDVIGAELITKPYRRNELACILRRLLDQTAGMKVA